MFTIFKVLPENYNITSIFLSGQDIEKFRKRVAGQYATLKLQKGSEWSKPHAFTISNAPQDDFIRMTIKAVGEFTSNIRNLQENTPALLDGPHGTFCSDIGRADSVVLVAGGIGITPFLSVLRNMKNIKSAPHSMILFWANNTTADFFGLEELKNLTDELGIVLVLVGAEGVPQPPASFLGGTTMHLESGLLTAELLKRYSDLNKSSIYLCGPPAMIDYTKGQVVSSGVEQNRIHIEKIIIPKMK